MCECLRFGAPEQPVEIRALSQNINWLCLECPFVLKAKEQLIVRNQKVL